MQGIGPIFMAYAQGGGTVLEGRKGLVNLFPFHGNALWSEAGNEFIAIQWEVEVVRIGLVEVLD